MKHDVNWRQRNDLPLITAEAAAAQVKPGDKVWLGGWNSVPTTLCAALAARSGELTDVDLYTFLSPFDWDQVEYRRAFNVHIGYAGALDRRAVQEGRFDYLPMTQWSAYRLPPGFDHQYDVAMIPISPPDADGNCSFGSGVWFGPTVVRHANRLIGEIHPEFIRTGGDNSVPISCFAAVCEGERGPPPAIAPRTPEAVEAADVICALVANELIADGSTIQVGVGDVSAALAVHLGGKHDLGVHTEIVPGGVAELVQSGVINGKRKELHPGKVVGCSLVQMSDQELAFIDGHPDFELYDFTYTDDLRNLLQLNRFVAVNNALFVDITGNVCSETMGPRVFSGPGGQPVFAIAASTSSGGSVIVLPSSQLVGPERRSRIQSTLDEGSTITVHRGYVDFVVTEQGIARLRGKSLRQRTEEMISIAHPDFRQELRDLTFSTYGLA